MKLKTIHYVVFFIVIAVGGLIAARMWGESQPGKYDTLAQCIDEADATFFGAFWCPHCEDQKRLFGNSQRLLPYVECSTPDGQNQTQACIDAEIKSYPTWVLADGTILNGVQQVRELAEATNCELPE
ncbi:hypothetical protein N9L26_01795 [Candidatus Pacebacteria bacterium]|nr:hypothetical protein [Candidatus Paceibacterota bacterium]